MRLTFLPLFVTLVVLHASAAPDTSVKIPGIQTKDSKPSPTPSYEKDLLQVTEPPPVSNLKIPFKKFTKSSQQIGVGVLSGNLIKDKGQESPTSFFYQRTHYNLNETAQEMSLAILTNNAFSLDLGFKKFCCFMSFAKAWEPFYKLGIAGVYEPKDELANFIDYQRYFLQLSSGFESLFSSRRSLRFEAGVRAGDPGIHFFGNFLYSFPD